MNCPDCGTPMNHHASMVIEPRNEAEEARFDPDLGGTVLERHTCPDCRESVTRLGGEGPGS
jgi:endogenous inhibitor of DNA gyrase (YacG/DUF329 family)